MTQSSLQPQRDAAPEAAAVVLVLPVGAIHPKSGGGQRSAILFEALKRIGDVVVLILAETPVTGAEEFFPGARRVVSFATPAMAAPSRNAVIRAAQAVNRFLFPGRTFAPQAGLSDAILHQFTHWDGQTAWTGQRLVAARYARTFAVTGLRSQPAQGLLTCLDIDDRDDQKIDLQIRRRLGNLLGTLARLLWRNRFTQTLHNTLTQTSLVYLAKPEDRFPLTEPPQVVVPNVPFLAPDAAEIVPVAGTAETILFVGSAGHRPNLAGVTWFLRACWPAIRAARPSATFRIVGLGDWSALPADLTEQPGVQVVGTVEDLSAEYALARAAICPIREGAGSQIKVIEACAFARPVVTTAFASGGFGPAIEAALSVATDAPGFVQACIDLLADPARAARQGAALHQLQQATHSRDAVERLIVTTLTDVMAQSRPLPKVPA
ncbi:glycosyltransferase family 4 protein [Tabrizicola sp. TH137]|uniref:glycosyltransferase family 4 protein n=1 Tax=Tabrizicola sp. TH137 TaxID=2067452 RepID=UPI00117E05B6|nr:glycosyltransferase family 4 protein [Tabrizicola sp. TH137]